MTEEYIYVAVDETGNLGRSLKGERYYTLVACVVNDRERFEDVTRRLGHSEEVKFNTHDGLRENEPRLSYIRSENVKAGGDLLPPYGRVQAHTDIHYGMPPEIPMKAESERKKRRQSFPMVPCEYDGFARNITVSERSRVFGRLGR